MYKASAEATTGTSANDPSRAIANLLPKKQALVPGGLEVKESVRFVGLLRDAKYLVYGHVLPGGRIAIGPDHPQFRLRRRSQTKVL